VATQQQIRAAVNNPFPETQFAATNAATTVGQIGTTLTAYDPCSLAYTYACWTSGAYGRGWGWGRPVVGHRR
jgi:hypothetical protein